MCHYFDRRGERWEYRFKTAGLAGTKQITLKHLWKVTNPLGESTTLEYTDLRNPQATPPSGAHENWYAPHRHEVTARVNALGKRWEYTYAAPEYTTSQGTVKRLMGNLATAEDPLGNTWAFHYDTDTAPTTGYDNLVAIEEPDAGGVITTAIAYNAVDGSGVVIDPTLPSEITLPEDQFGQLGTVTLSYWGTSDYGGNAYGELRSVTDANGVDTLFRYDTRGQLSRVEEGPITQVGTWQKVMSLVHSNKVGQVIRTLQFGEQETVTGGGSGTRAACSSPGSCPASGARISYDSCTCSKFIMCDCFRPWIPPCPEEEDDEGCTASASAATRGGEFDGYQIPNVCARQGPTGELHGNATIVRDHMGRPTFIETANLIDSSQNFPNMRSTETLEYDALGRLTSRTSFTSEMRACAQGGQPEGLTRTFEYEYDDVNGTVTRDGPDGQRTVVQRNEAGRVTAVHRFTMSGGQPAETVLFAEYEYYANGQVKKIAYGNGTRVEYIYDDAERLSEIRHSRVSDNLTLLRLEYEYNQRGLITGIEETDPAGGSTTTFAYDDRGRLIEEMRAGDHAYWIEYEYDQGGNRKKKLEHDTVSGDIVVQTLYRYDTDPENVDCDGDGDDERPPGECYQTRNNRLMSYERQVWVASVGIFRRAEAVWYQYEVNGAAAGNANYIVHKFYNPNQPFQQPFCRAFYLHYDDRGELWFVAQREWQQGPNLDCSVDAETTSVREFRANGRTMRFTADRTTGGGNILESTRVWHDYDGDEIYADVRIDFEENMDDFTTTEIASHEPGMGSRDWTAAAGSQTTYRHGDQIGTTRAVSDQPTSGDPAVTGRIVYTAFGERVWSDGSIGTRYQYAGAWGYQTFPPYAGTSEDELPFIHVGHRWYDPSTGRFLQRDPIGIAGGANVYVYVGNAPTNAVDPQGLRLESNLPVHSQPDIQPFLPKPSPGSPQSYVGDLFGLRSNMSWGDFASYLRRHRWDWDFGNSCTGELFGTGSNVMNLTLSTCVGGVRGGVGTPPHHTSWIHKMFPKSAAARAAGRVSLIPLVWEGFWDLGVILRYPFDLN